jgi:starch synthase
LWQSGKIVMKLAVLFATSEITPWVKTGGLGDVAAALPPALRAAGIDVRVLVPCYPALAAAFPDAAVVASLDSLGGLLPPTLLREAVAPDGTPLLLLDCPACFARPGNPYLGGSSGAWHDNHIRFGLLSRVAALLGSDDSPLSWRPRIVHCNDWQTALAPAYLHHHRGERARSLVTVHNLAFQGLFGHHALAALGLPESAWAIGGVEYHGFLSFLKAGLQYSDWITTVSPSYAREICTDAEGMGLAGLLRWRAHRLSGILNGIDTLQWNPATDANLAAPYDIERIAAKARNKAALQRRAGLEPRKDLPLFGVVSRLTEQKGLDLLPILAEKLVEIPAQLVLLGSGSAELEQTFSAMAKDYPQAISATIGFDEGLSHLIEAGADLFLMPSRFEPCGLNQMYSLRYGTPPIVRATGGLADTVVDCTAANLADGSANGFVFAESTPEALWEAMLRAVIAWHQPRIWRQLQGNGMARDSGWAAPAQQYAELYRSLDALGTMQPDSLTA